jgi:hypothetical protein
VLEVATALGGFRVPLLDLPAPPPGGALTFSVRAERLIERPDDTVPNRIALRCITVEYFGAYRRHVLEGADGTVVKYDQFGAMPQTIREGEQITLGWSMENAVLHRASPA